MELWQDHSVPLCLQVWGPRPKAVQESQLIYDSGVFRCAQLGLEEGQPQPCGWVVPRELTTSGSLPGHSSTLSLGSVKKKKKKCAGKNGSTNQYSSYEKVKKKKKTPSLRSAKPSLGWDLPSLRGLFPRSVIPQQSNCELD